MLKKYCVQCRHVCEEDQASCPFCLGPLRDADENDLAFLVTIEAESFAFLQEDLTKEGISFEAEDCPLPPDGSVYSGKGLLPSKNVFVPVRNLDRADRVLAQTFENVEEMNKMPQGKRIAVQVLSILAFIAAIWLVVRGADALVGWIRSFFVS